MKTIVKMLAVATMLVACYAVNAATVNTNSNVETAVETSVTSSDYEYVQQVSIVKISGHVKIKNSAKLYTKNDVLYVCYNGEYYRVRPSDRADYGYMFYQGNGVWYFNY